MITRALLLLLAFALLPPALHAEEQPATTLKATELRDEPYSDAALLGTIDARQQLSVLERKGGWYRVGHGQQHGWLRMSAIRFGNGETAQRDGSGLGQTLRFLSTGRSGASGVTVATGIRGLDAADVAKATPDHAAVSRLNGYRANNFTIEKFARDARLKSQPLGYLAADEGGR